MTRATLRKPTWTWVAAAELPIVLLIAPALLFPTPHRLLAMLAIPITWLACRALGGRWIPATPLNLPVLALLAMTAVSAWATFDITLSLGKISGVCLGALLFWAATRWTRDAARLRVATGAFLAAGGTLAILGLLGTNWIDKFPVLGPAVSHMPKLIHGIPGAKNGFQPNAVAGCLVLFVPLQIALIANAVRTGQLSGALRSIRWPLLIQCALLAITGGTLALTQSRGAAVGLLVAAVAAAEWAAPRLRVLAAVALVTVGVAIAAFSHAGLLELLVRLSGSGLTSDISSRTELWTRAVYAISDFPLTGMGMNTFRDVLPLVYPAALTPWHADVAHAHNHLLQAALDLGLPGLVAYLAMWLGTAALLVRVYHLSSKRIYRTMAGGLGAGLIAHFMFGMTDVISLGAKVGVLFWMTLAFCVSLHQVALPERPVPEALE